VHGTTTLRPGVGEVLEREFSNPVRFEAHSLSVDSYVSFAPAQCAPHLIHTVLMFVNSRMPWTDSSRP